ncbi:ribosomal protein S5, C-terminal domain-containing protein [Lipomyces arxii]|uniref:mitochondrial 37S ribosomal protein uS5m n=1 Tax=Lipomyces arxii TaxID=56418 RepID=UPI0034CFD836
MFNTRTYRTLRCVRDGVAKTTFRRFASSKSTSDAAEISAEGKAIVAEEFRKIMSRSEHIQRLSKYYTPRMLKAIVAAERAVTPELWLKKKDQLVPFGVSYREDFVKHDKFYDIGIHPWTNFDEAYQPVPKDTDIPKQLPGDKNSSEVIEEQIYNEKGMTSEYIRSLTVKPLVTKFVSNVTRLGKVRSYYCLTVVGDKNGMIGVGEATDRTELSTAMARAQWKAIKKMQYIPRMENRTIFGSLEGNYHAVDIKLWPRPPGFGLRVNHLVHEVAACAGIKDLSGKVFGSRNKMNTVKGVIKLLQQQVMPEEIAQARGKKVVDIRKSYFSRS